MSPTLQPGHFTRVDDRAYGDVVWAAAERTKRRVWASVFICDLRPHRDVEGRILDLISTLVERRQWGVDVRVLLTGDATAGDIVSANLASGLYLHHAGVPIRRVLTLPDGRLGTHAKFVLCDDMAVVGSQNWTDDGFRLNIEDAIMVGGRPVETLEREFLRLWSHGRGVPRAAD